jgi:hypothetical protein
MRYRFVLFDEDWNELEITYCSLVGLADLVGLFLSRDLPDTPGDQPQANRWKDALGFSVEEIQ